MRRVEFAGLPGSGKTTILGGARAALCREGSLCFDRTRLAGLPGPLPSRLLEVLQRLAPPPWRARVARHLFWRTILPEAKARVPEEYPELLSAICRAVASDEEDPVFARHFIRLAVDVMAWNLIASDRLREDEVFLCDEGFVQRAISLHAQGEPKDWAALIPRIDLLFVVRASRETCIARMRARNRGLTRRFVGRPETEVEAVLGLMERAARDIEQELARRGTEIVRLDTDELDLTAGTQVVVDRTTDWLPRTRRQCRRDGK